MDMRNEKFRMQIDAERDRLFLVSSAETGTIPFSDQYQRMRFEREIEGNQFVVMLKRGTDRVKAAYHARKEADRKAGNWKKGDVP